MNRRKFLKSCLSVAGGATILSSHAACGKGNGVNPFTVPDAGKRRPNIVFFMIDDMGWRDVGFNGSRYYQTPNIDKLAGEGMIFTNAYANAANCAPTRACFLTGQYTPRHSVYTVGSPARGKSKNRRLIPVNNTPTLASSHITIAEVLKTAGYVSASMGKWHMGDSTDTLPTGQGFDVNVAGNHSGGPVGGYFSPYKNPQLSDGPEGEYLTDRLSKEAVGFIETNKDRPFFLYLTHYAVHTPIQAKADLVAKYESKPGADGQDDARYAAMIDSVDQGVGKVLKTLEDLKLTEDTVVIFFSDNGGYGPATSMKPLRGSKGMFYEGGIREPMIVKWPGRVKPTAHCDVPVIGTDFFPTLMEIAGAKKPEGKILDGLSLLPLLAGGDTLNREAIFWHFPAYLQAYSRNMEDARDPKFRSRPVSVIRKGRWKLLQYFEEWALDGGRSAIDTNNAVELYDLENDPAEANNIASTNKKKRGELLNDLIAWQRTVNAPIPTEPNPEYTG